MRLRLLPLVALCVASVPFSALAVESETGSEPAPEREHPAAVETVFAELADGDPPAACFAGKGALVGGSKPVLLAGPCIADCWDGSTITCTGAHCWKYDSACTAERGRCWGSTSGNKYCPICCGTYTACSTYQGRSCSGSTTVSCVDGGSCGSCSCLGGTMQCT